MCWLAITAVLSQSEDAVNKAACKVCNAFRVEAAADACSLFAEGSFDQD